MESKVDVVDAAEDTFNTQKRREQPEILRSGEN